MRPLWVGMAAVNLKTDGARAPKMPSRERALQLLDDEATAEVAIPPEMTPNPVAQMAETYARKVDASRKMASYGVLAAGLSHHVLNPLAAIAANAEMMPAFLKRIERFASTPVKEDLAELAEMATEITAAVGRITEIVYGLSSLGAGRNHIRVAPLGLARVVASVVEGAPEGAAVHVDVPEDLEVPADATAIEHIVAQLVSNAIEAGARNVWLDVDVGSPTILTVADDGPGVSLDDEIHIFQPFFSGWGRPQHFGMGLPSSRLLAEAMGGKLVHERRAGGGAAFRVVFAEL